MSNDYSSNLYASQEQPENILNEYQRRIQEFKDSIGTQVDQTDKGFENFS